MNDTTESNTIAGLPIPPKEKVARWAAHGGIIALGVAGILTFMPYINKAIGLVLDGAISLAQLGLVGAGICFGAFAIMTAWPLYKKFIESCANKATWALFEYDPITPMMLWLKEVRRDRDQLETEYRNVEAVIAQNEQTVNDNLKAAEVADKKFSYAVKQYGEDSPEAQLMSLEPGTLRETAERIKANTEPLHVVRDTLKEIVDATAFTERKAELDVAAFEQEFTAAKSIESATNAANRVLKARSERKQNAMLSMKIIHDRYAGSFGRLQGLRQLSREIITSVDMAKGTYHQEALERLKAESRFITGARKPEVLDAQKVDQVQGVSFYKVPELPSRVRK